MPGTDSNFASLSSLFPFGGFEAEEVASVFWCCSYLRLQKSRLLVKIVASNFICCSTVVLGSFYCSGSCHAQHLARSHGMLPGCLPPGVLGGCFGFVWFGVFLPPFFTEAAGYGLCSTTLE